MPETGLLQHGIGRVTPHLLLPSCTRCPGNSVDLSNLVSPSWAWGKGVVQTSDGRTIICFSRQASVVTSASAGTSGRRLKQQAATSTPSTASVSTNLDLMQSRSHQGHNHHTCHIRAMIVITLATSGQYQSSHLLVYVYLYVLSAMASALVFFYNKKM